VGDLTPYNGDYQSSLHTMTSALAAQSGGATAQGQAVGFMYQTLLSQASLLAYVDIFVLFGALCLACFVGALMLKKIKVNGPISAH
jgi:DHA2 family multidrug resistance protein